MKLKKKPKQFQRNIFKKSGKKKLIVAGLLVVLVVFSGIYLFITQQQKLQESQDVRQQAWDGGVNYLDMVLSPTTGSSLVFDKVGDSQPIKISLQKSNATNSNYLISAIQLAFEIELSGSVTTFVEDAAKEFGTGEDLYDTPLANDSDFEILAIDIQNSSSLASQEISASQDSSDSSSRKYTVKILLAPGESSLKANSAYSLISNQVDVFVFSVFGKAAGTNAGQVKIEWLDENYVISEISDALFVDLLTSKPATYILGGATEICTGGKDDDGDTYIDCADSDCFADPVCASTGVCGDGLISTSTTSKISTSNVKDEVSEECDDGNTTNGDGCASDCTIEAGWTCTNDNPSQCTQANEICDNGIDDDQNGATDCDDKNCENDPACSSSPNDCGDGALDQANEECDDGNTTNGDGCASDCTIEAGWTCTTNSSGYSECTQASGDISLTFKLKLVGVPYVEGTNAFHPVTAGQDLQVKVMAKNIDTKEVLPPVLMNFSYVEDGVNSYYSNSSPLELTDVSSGNYHFFFKGPKHRQMQLCQDGQLKDKICTISDGIALSNGDKLSLDFTGVELEPGDMPISEIQGLKDQQDGYVNPKDYSVLYACNEKFLNLAETEINNADLSDFRACLSRADLDYSGMIDGYDFAVIKKTMSVKPDDA